jgi:hypothetical protein
MKVLRGDIDPGRLRGQFLTMVERLFPDDVERVEKRLGTRKR